MELNRKTICSYREGKFGLATGLIKDDSRLLGRTILLVDIAGIVRYIQVVPKITRMPDMEEAFAMAMDLSK
jgi:thiol peroxidase